MRILKVIPERDSLIPYNYHINYGVWDEIKGDSVIIEQFNANLDNYDVALLPMKKRWKNHLNLLDNIKNHKIKSILFDNDSCFYSFHSNFFNGLDFVFYRDLDIDRKRPLVPSARMLWSIDTSLYTPVYGGHGISFNCTTHHSYPLRGEIKRLIGKTNHKRGNYINHLQNSAAAIHTNSPALQMVRAKVLEFASCGTQIISNPCTYMDYYFPDNLIIYFDTIEELRYIITNFEPDIDKQKELRAIAEKHDNKIRAKWVLQTIQNLFSC